MTFRFHSWPLAAALMAFAMAAPVAGQTCGGTVTGDVTMSGDLTCGGPTGLTLAAGAVLDMDGHTLSCSAAATGIVVGAGAELKNGKVAGCTIGVSVTGNGATVTRVISQLNSSFGFQVVANDGKLVENVAEGCVDGFSVSGDSNKLLRNVALSSSGSGIIASGDGNKISENAVQNFTLVGIDLTGPGSIAKNAVYGDGFGQIGIQASAAKLSGNTVAGVNGTPGNGYSLTDCKASSNVAVANGNVGFLIAGDTSLSKNIAAGNSQDGFRVNTPGASLKKNLAASNNDDGFDLQAAATVSGNTASANSNRGFFAAVSGLEISKNVAIANAAYDLADSSLTCSGNLWSDNVEGTTQQGCED